MMYRTVTIEPVIHSSLIEVTAELFDSTISASAEFSMPVKIYNIDPDYYEGPYIVDPDFIGQTLETDNKHMTDDVTVNPIQVETVSNIGGGYTVYIGGII